MKRTILIVDDEMDMLMLLQRSLSKDLDCEVEIASSGEMALELLKKHTIDLMLADIKMPGMNGIDLLKMAHKRYPDLTVVMMTAFGHIDMAVDAMKNGAYDFVTKPFDHDALVMRLEKALERTWLVKENMRLQKECRDSAALEQLVGKSAPMQKVFETIQMVAKTDLTVLITGESGTGKDLTARAIHALSSRANESFVAVNCPTVPENILESELFGYKKGAFTHATQNRIGLFQEADGGTIFLDEIGDVAPSIQTKLLRVIQEKEFKPLGDNKAVQVDVRIIASTNQDLKEKIRKGEFREDFYYRLNVLPIHLPPLRERRQDIPLIVNHLLEKHCAELNKPLKKITPEFMERLVGMEWEGNVRELENVIMRAILFSQDDVITLKDAGFQTDAGAVIGDPCATFRDMPYKQAKEKMLYRFNHEYIGNLLLKNGGNVTRAARQCGMERQALQQIMRRFNINADDYRK